MANIIGSVGRNQNRFTYYLSCTEQDISGSAENRSKVRVGIRIASGGSSRWASRSASATHNIIINGINYSCTSGAYVLQGGEDIEIAYVVSDWISHDSDGSKIITISSNSPDLAQGNGYGPYSGSASGTLTLTKIPRYTTITSFSVDKRDETSLTFKWQTADTIDYAWYSTDNGSTWAGYNVTDGTSGSFIVSKLSSNTDTNLSANTAYNCKLRVRRKDSQLNTDSSTVQQTTYDYPYCTDSPNFTIGNRLTLTFYNPLNRTMKVEFIGADNSICDTWNGAGTTITGYNGSTTISNLYASIPNSNSGKYKVRITYGSSVKTRDNGNTYSVNVNNSKPTFSNFDYDDTNSTTLALTGNSKILIKGYSDNKITISTANKATAKNSATMSSYEVNQGIRSAKANYSSSTAVTMNMSAIENNTITVTAIDSRKNSTSVTKTLNSTYYKEYSALVIKTATVKRSNNGVGQNVTLAFNGTFWNSSFGNVSNDIISATYQYKETTSSSWSSAIALTVSKSGKNFSYSGTIRGDLAANGFSVEKSFNIRVTVKDKLVTKTYDIILGAGTPAIAIYKDKVAIGKKYDTSTGGALQVNGDINITNGSASSAKKLANAKTINGTEFSNEFNIKTKFSYNLERDNIKSATENYTMFARTDYSNPTGNCSGTFLVTGLGPIGGTIQGVWLVQISNRGSKATMSVLQLIGNNAGTVEFGWVRAEDYFYFGCYANAYGGTLQITVLQDVEVDIQIYMNTTSKPSGWTAVTINKVALQ